METTLLEAIVEALHAVTTPRFFRSERGYQGRFYTFQCNQPAGYFYERRGFKAIASGDGSGNGEKCPDILYEWQPGR